MRALLSLVLLGLSGFVSWLFWGPVYHFLVSCIPATAHYAWAGKIVCLFVVGWLGGIGLPLLLLCLAVSVLVA